MKIYSVSVRYSELRSTGYPTFSNRTFGIELSANLDSGDTAVVARDRLLMSAKRSVAKMFKSADEVVIDDSEMSEMTIPF